MTGQHEPAPGRRWFNIGAVKIPHAERDLAHAALGDRPDETLFADIVGADTTDDDARFPVGSHTTYRAALTDAQAAAFAEASNVRYVSEDVVMHGMTCSSASLPGFRVRETLRYWPTAHTDLPGTSVNVAVLDGGTSTASRSYMGHILVARGVFMTPAPPLNETYTGYDHGALCASNAVSPQGRLIDVVVINESDASTDSGIAQGVTYAVNQGAKVLSGSFGYASTPMPATRDAIVAAASSDVIMYFSTGNEGNTVLRYPARYMLLENIPYLYSVGGWDMAAGYRWVSSSWDPAMTGVAPSIMVRGLTADARPADWQGTSAATPCVVNMAARLIGAGYTARAVGTALKSTTDQRGLGTAVGGGVFDLRAAAASLGITIPPAPVGIDPRRRVNAGAAAVPTSPL